MAQESYKQNLHEKAEFQRTFQIQLLFEENGVRPSTENILAEMEKTFGKVDLISAGSLTAFGIHKYPVEYKDHQAVPAQLLISDFEPFDKNSITALEKSQLWDCPDAEPLLDNCRYKLMLSDFMASGLDYKCRCEMLADWLETVLRLFPDCTAVWTPSSGKLLRRKKILENPVGGAGRFLLFGVNARFFNIEGTGDMIVDTLGLYAVGLPDIQYHFHGLDPNKVVNHAYNVASYIFENDAPIKSGETIDGISEIGIDRGVRWKCQYEMGLIQPSREVMDICPGEYASGTRE